MAVLLTFNSLSLSLCFPNLVILPIINLRQQRRLKSNRKKLNLYPSFDMKIICTIRTLLILMLSPMISFGFNLSITHTNETCAGNGSLLFSVSNTNPNGSIVYIIYKLPDLTTPYASGPNTTLNGLSAGDYRVIARETVGSISTTQQQDITITSSFEPLSYTIQVTNQACTNTGVVTVTAVTGTPATYAIISGPTTFPSQSSNTFSGLAAGVYRFKVTDVCGNSVVQAYTVTLNPPSLSTINPNFTNTTPPSCSLIVATNTLSAGTGTVIAYPLQVHYVLHLPTGDTHINTVLNSGDPSSQEISQTIPYLINQNYVYDVILTDACGITYPLNNFIVNHDIALSQTIHTLPCNNYYFTLNADDYTSSYTIQFTVAPAGFNPADFNSNYPGPFNQSEVDFGSTSNFVPFGDYSVTITDACGTTDTTDFTIEDTPPVPNLLGFSNSCFNNDGTITASIANRKIVTAVITVAPAEYPIALPHNVTALIDDAGALLVTPVPLGDYTLLITDECGTIYDPLVVTVGPYENRGLKIDVLQGCGEGYGSLKMMSNNSKLISVKITAAPGSFAFPLPYDISNNIVGTGQLYFSGLPAGNYTFDADDDCGFKSTETITIEGYKILTNSFSLVADCGVFSVPLDFTDNLTVPELFGLQKLLNAGTNTWGNPISGEAYVEGTPPNGSNSYMLENNTTNFNLTFNGVFRIVHHYTSFNNGSDINSGLVRSEVKDCIEILSPTLSFTNALAITGVRRIPCSTSGNFDVIVNTTGPAPLHYSIVEKDGIPLLIDNGTSNIFLNVSPGIYQFEVEDSCGNSINQTFDVSDLSSLVTIFPVCNILYCTPSITGNETFDLSAQNPFILGQQSTSEYTLTYHTSLADAENNNNPISNVTAFNPTGNQQTIYIRLIFNQLPNCYQTASFDVITGQKPNVDLLSEYVICDGPPVVLDASAGNLPSTQYAWFNGLSTPDISISAIGTTNLAVTAINDYGICDATSQQCTTSKDITVIIADVPVIDHIDTHDWTDNENSITVITTHEGDFEYSLDGITYQSSNSFQNLRPGVYTVFVRDRGGCKIVTQEIWLLNYPKFFTPNGDGYNDTWFIKNSEKEPNFKVYIFDRYGKLIADIVANEPGWDGTLNGRLLFADDYWFAAYRQDGRILRGHFTLKR